MKKLMITLAAVALAAPLALAEPGGKGGPGKGGKGGKGGPGALDTDKNGEVSKEEFIAAPRAKDNPEKAAEMFARLDADDSGAITKEEFAAAAKARRGGDKGKKGPKPPKGDEAPE